MQFNSYNLQKIVMVFKILYFDKDILKQYIF